MIKPRKIPMIKREQSKQRSVTFTKRRNGLFSKAGELCRLFSGVQLSILVKSTNHGLNGNVYSCSNGTAALEAFLADTYPRVMENQTKEESVDDLITEIDSLEELCKLEQSLKSLREKTKSKLDILRAAESISAEDYDDGNWFGDIHLGEDFDNIDEDYNQIPICLDDFFDGLDFDVKISDSLINDFIM
ncbi:hypothetical protein ACFE04_007366 [Oxalis oulophora]